MSLFLLDRFKNTLSFLLLQLSHRNFITLKNLFPLYIILLPTRSEDHKLLYANPYMKTRKDFYFYTVILPSRDGVLPDVSSRA